MKYEILGPPRIVHSGKVSFIGAPKLETIITVLLIRADRVVSSEQLINEAWGEEPPRRAMASLHVHISQLRKLIQGAGRADSPVITRPPGYLLRLGTDELDLNVFLGLIEIARSHMRLGRHEDAYISCSQALRLCQEPVINNASRGPILEGFATWLSEVRLESTEILMDAQLMLGRHREIISSLYSLVAECPLREAFRRQLMVALYRSERQADALEVYQQTRKVLNDELGLEPGQALRHVQEAILNRDERLIRPEERPESGQAFGMSGTGYPEKEQVMGR
jgi:DNA-binding SARP family transcriptional activator